MNIHANQSKPSLEHFEAWLRRSDTIQSPDVTERVLQTIQQPVASPRNNPNPILVMAMGIAAVVMLALFLVPAWNSPQELPDTPYIATHTETVTDLILDTILLEEAPMESVVWLLEEDNQFTLASYLPVTH